jgi:hypothetical protein
VWTRSGRGTARAVELERGDSSFTDSRSITPAVSFEDFSSEHGLDGPWGDGAPPDDVLEEIGLAGEVYQRLADRGRELRFWVDPSTGRITIGVHEADGTLLYTILPSRALEIAGGEDVDEV